jgi:hypothetical protein
LNNLVSETKPREILMLKSHLFYYQEIYCLKIQKVSQHRDWLLHVILVILATFEKNMVPGQPREKVLKTPSQPIKIS